MTDITEMAQRARINAECGEHLSPAETMKLVEALASEKRICATWRKTAEANSEKLEKAQQRIAELESRTVKLPAERFCPAEYAGSQLWSETEVWNKAITTCADALRAAGIKVEVK